jgi:hypothetical protein
VISAFRSEFFNVFNRVRFGNPGFIQEGSATEMAQR